ncbi:hypothetical protein BDV96DRAFT_579217 [Lophiotrema nucula]|uniref:Uncharacterized protein n=1 Tax=Lophiotrema nucula TaxID=690887 RepID=A0A6A5Z167_9PLEO|nr:hypothetical protein BDV96DRAFT_579217 [Lophiotrema nucula]
MLASTITREPTGPIDEILFPWPWQLLLQHTASVASIAAHAADPMNEMERFRKLHQPQTYSNFSIMGSYLFLVYLLVSCLRVSADVTSTNKQNCSCGFYDANTRERFTESIIAYFNETDSLPEDFVVGSYEHKYEKDWNAVYRQGAHSDNVQTNESDTLQLYVSPPSSRHLVRGSEIRTARRDIQHGSFRAFVQPARQNQSGSAMSMMWQYNQSETAEISVMNTDNPSQAWVGTFVNNEFTSRDLGVNFSTAANMATSKQNYTILGTDVDNGMIDLWNFTEYRIDWTADYINFYVASNLSRSVLHATIKSMPSVPAPFYFKHWSTGNRFSMEGPPRQRSVANVGWIRMFFNSSSMTQAAWDDFAVRCSLEEACSTDDVTLRGSTPYTEHSLKKWKQKSSHSIKRMPALWISVTCISLSTLLLLHALLRRAPWRKQSQKLDHGPQNDSLTNDERNKSVQSRRASGSNPSVPDSSLGSNQSSFPGTTVSTRSASTNYDVKHDEDDLAIEEAISNHNTSVYCSSMNGGSSRSGSLPWDSLTTTPHLLSPNPSTLNTTVHGMLEMSPSSQSRFRNMSLPRHDSEQTLVAPPSTVSSDKIRMETVTESALPAPRMRAQPPLPRERVDYLAGLVALCAILVTVMHFGLTFVPAMVIPGAPQHHRSEYWAQQLVAPFILNQMWLGVFFTTSVRFLVSGYLKRGNMQVVAKAAVRRTPRLMIPVASIALLEYFVIDIGATTYLSYIPSITWSTWPYVTRFETIGHFISEVLELIYLVPNAVPQITFNYCTGVLWTIAVQLQGSWLVLCGVIVVREIKTPWKRMGYYVFALINHWYAQSWGSYLWFGLLLTDLDVTFKYKPWLHKRPLAYYPLITFCWLCVAAGFAANISLNWTTFNFPAYENNIHPDVATGEPLWKTPNAGYPMYYVPRLNGLLFAAGMQAIVELSPAVQWVLSLPFLLVLFPHIFTIYLIHGLIFWTWGSWLMIFLASRDFGYSINVTIVGITSYVVIFLCLPIITPIIEALGKDITALVWMSAIEKPPPRRRTLFPFPEDLLERRGKTDVEAQASASSSSFRGSGNCSTRGKYAMKQEVKEID